MTADLLGVYYSVPAVLHLHRGQTGPSLFHMRRVTAGLERQVASLPNAR